MGLPSNELPSFIVIGNNEVWHEPRTLQANCPNNDERTEVMISEVKSGEHF